MLKFLKAGLILTGFLLPEVCFCQNIPLGTLPMFFNSSFAGEGDGPRFNSNLSFQRYKNGGNTIFSFASYDQFVPKLRSGVGISAHYSNTLGGFFNSNYSTVALAIAPKFSIKGKFTISPSLDVQYGRQNNNFSYANGYSTRAGLLMNSSRFFLGYSVHLYNHTRFKDRTTSEVDRYNNHLFNNLLMGMQIGYTFQRSQDAKFSFTPQMLLMYHKEPDNKGSLYPKMMMNFRYNKVLWGVSDDGIHLGWQTPRVRIMVFNNIQRFFIKDHNFNYSTLSFRYNFTK